MVRLRAQRGKADRGLLGRFLAKATGLSRAQVTRLTPQHRTTGGTTDCRGAPRRMFPRRYTNADIGLSAEIDALHGTLSGPATRKLCTHAFHLFGEGGFERLAPSRTASCTACGTRPPMRAAAG